jgi:hypothetical protein
MFGPIALGLILFSPLILIAIIIGGIGGFIHGRINRARRRRRQLIDRGASSP